jgi:hypothetical protein
LRLLRREAARADEATASGTWGRGRGDDGVMYWGTAAAGCDLTTLFVCLRVMVGRLALTGPVTFQSKMCGVPGAILVTASCAL